LTGDGTATSPLKLWIDGAGKIPKSVEVGGVLNIEWVDPSTLGNTASATTITASAPIISGASDGGTGLSPATGDLTDGSTAGLAYNNDHFTITNGRLAINQSFFTSVFP
jgi:hypothetical protein